MLEARGLVKSFAATRAVDGVDLSVAPGERVALLGAVTPDAGEVSVLGHGLPAGRSAAMAGVGFAAGYLPLPDHLLVREVLEVFARLYGVADVRDAVDSGLERFGVAHLAGRLSTELSSGQRTLVGIVKATLHHPRLLVLDEPTASLDPDVAHRVREGLERACREDGTALLVTSHNMTDVERVCERVVFLSAGRVVADGSPAEVAARFERSSLEEVFLHLASEEAP